MTVAMLLAACTGPSALDSRTWVDLTHSFDADTVYWPTASGFELTVDSKGEKTTVARSDIEEIQPSAQSIMPERLLESLQPQEVRDLFSYLQSDPPARSGKLFLFGRVHVLDVIKLRRSFD